MHVDYSAKTRTKKTYGKYVECPVGVSGIHHVVSIQTEEDRVHLSMIALFCYKEVIKIHYLSRQASFYMSKIGKYFTFPENKSKPVSVNNFNKNEKKLLKLAFGCIKSLN